MISVLRAVVWREHRGRKLGMPYTFYAGLGTRLSFDPCARAAYVEHVTHLGGQLGELVVVEEFPLRDVLQIVHVDADAQTVRRAA